MIDELLRRQGDLQAEADAVVADLGPHVLLSATVDRDAVVDVAAGSRGTSGCVWFVDEPERQPDLGHVRALPDRITPETRAAILLIKHSRPACRSFDVHRSVLDDGVRTPEDYDRWRVTHGQ
ncbi:hypothetical protein AB0H12_30140 [Actinosynnema sp. NPDC023794]